MKRKILITSALAAILLGACAPVGGSSSSNFEPSSNSSEFGGSSENSSSEDTSHETSSENQNSVFGDVTGGASMSENKVISLGSGYVLNRYSEGEAMLLDLHEMANFIIINSDHEIIYTAANVKAGYGRKGSAYSKDFAFEIIEDKLVIPEGCMGYNLSDTGYAKLVNYLTNNAVVLELDSVIKTTKLDNWNKESNEYISNDFKFQVYKESDYVKNNEVIRFSSIYDNLNSDGVAIYKMVAPYDDTYDISFVNASKVSVFNEDYEIISENNEAFEVELFKNQVVYMVIEGSPEDFFNVDVTLNDHKVELPYEVLDDGVDLNELDLYGNPNVDPMESQELKVTKRSDSRGLYVNCNNPEGLGSECINTVLTRQEVGDKDTFFTFEHNNKTTQKFYYAYRVTNTDTKDIYVTVKNAGLHIGGAGSWLGEDEWIKFYNTKFEVDQSEYTKSQMDNFIAYVGFSGEYESADRQPITYRLPAGKYIYVMGGTTEDAYQNINVFGQADQKVNPSATGCSNGAVLFSVRGGKALGQFMCYRKPSEINKSSYVKNDEETGYMRHDGHGAQYVGYDTCHGVVDTALTYTFNDKTPNGPLKVNYSNPYYTNNRNGEIYSEIPSFSTRNHVDRNGWVTHINPNVTPEAIGTDMTRYITTDFLDKLPICIDVLHFDGRGTNANIGNWMVDYIDTFTLINQGNKDRTFNYRMRHSGVILTFIRDENGKVDPNYTPTYNVKIASSGYGEGIDQTFDYTVTIPAHSVIKFSVDYNLLANSNGYISHNITLGEPD